MLRFILRKETSFACVTLLTQEKMKETGPKQNLIINGWLDMRWIVGGVKTICFEVTWNVSIILFSPFFLKFVEFIRKTRDASNGNPNMWRQEVEEPSSWLIIKTTSSPWTSEGNIADIRQSLTPAQIDVDDKEYTYRIYINCTDPLFDTINSET